MSPAKRRRIAGESGPGSPSRPAPRKPVVPKPAEVVEDVVETPEVEAPEVEETVVPELAAEDSASELEDAAELPVEEAPEEPAAQPTKPAVPTANRRKPEAPVPPRAVESGEGRTGSSALLVIATLSLALLAGGSFLLWRGIDKATEEPDTRAAQDAAAVGIETIFSYSFENLDEHLKESSALMTDKYADEFEEIHPSLEETAPQNQSVSQAIVRGTPAPMACGQKCSSDRMKLLVFYDQAQLTNGEKTPTVSGRRVTVELVKDGDRWLINGIEAL